MNIPVPAIPAMLLLFIVFSSVHAKHCQGISSFMSFTQLPHDQSLFASEYAFSHGAEVVLLIVYVSTLCLSGLQNVLILSCFKPWALSAYICSR